MKLKELIRRIALNRREESPFPEDLETFLEDFIPNTLLKSETLQRAFDVSGYEMEEIYSETYTFYQEDNFLEASTGFRWLVLLNPFVEKYWMGLAASLQLLEKYEKALHAYAICALLESENPYPHFHAFECYVALKDKEEAEKALSLAFKRTIGKAAYRDLQEEIELLRKKAGGLLCRSEYKIS
jgi:type III secretion system low calcium response chaperone LcrH/SycD